MSIEVTIGGSGIEASVSTKQVVLAPELQTVWDDATNPEKDTFVDANDTEILTFMDITLIALSTEGEVAVQNIQSNGGVLTDAEKIAVDTCVIRLVASGDWTTRDYILYGGFADNICNLSDWKSGILAVAVGGGVTFDGESWVFDGASYIDLGFAPSEGTSTSVSASVSVGIKENKLEDNGDALLGCTDSATGTGVVELTTRLGGYFVNMYSTAGSTQQALGLSNDNFITNNRDGLFTVKAYRLGEIIWNRSGATFRSIPTTNLYLGATNLNGVASGIVPSGTKLNFVQFGQKSIDQLDFTAAFYDFQTTLHPEILYNTPQPTGQTVVYRTGDDASIEQTVFKPYRRVMSFWNGTAPKLKDFWTLQDNNVFGNTSRFTNEQGDYVDVYNNIYYLANGTVATSAIYTTNEYMIDNYTGAGIYLKPSEPWNVITLDWNAGIDWGINGASIAGYTDYFMANQKQIQSLEPMEIMTPLGGSVNTYITWRPFNLFSAYLFNNTTASSSTAPNSTTSSIGYGNPQVPIAGAVAKTLLRQCMKIRKHF